MMPVIPPRVDVLPASSKSASCADSCPLSYDANGSYTLPEALSYAQRTGVSYMRMYTMLSVAVCLDVIVITSHDQLYLDTCRSQ